MARPLLGDVELQQVQKIETEEDQVFTQHSIPALEGDFFQGLGRRATWVKLTGVLTGAEVQEGLKTLRDKFRAAEPVDFVADITTATKVNQVIIEEMGVRELAGKPSRFEYALTLREFISPPRPEAIAQAQPVNDQVQEQAAEISSQQVDNIVNEAGVLEVQVDLEDGGDYSALRVVVESESSDGASFSTWSQEQLNGLYRFEGLQAGTYTVRVELQ
jgi:hypothetical protein